MLEDHPAKQSEVPRGRRWGRFDRKVAGRPSLSRVCHRHRCGCHTSHSRPELCVRVLDVQSDEIGCRTWDLVHIRSVLTYLSDRTQVVRRLIAALKPGGHLLIEEPYFVDLTACENIAQESVRNYGQALRKMVIHAGADAQFGLRVPQILADAGLQCESQVVGFAGRAGDGGWGDFMVSRSSLESRRMVELGLLSEEAATAAVRQLSSGIEHNPYANVFNLGDDSRQVGGPGRPGRCSTGS